MSLLSDIDSRFIVRFIIINLITLNLMPLNCLVILNICVILFIHFITHGHPRSKIIFVGCKYDIFIKKRFDEKILQDFTLFAEERISSFIPISAKDNINVHYLFLQAINLAMSRWDNNGNTDTFKLKNETMKKNRKCC